MRRALSVLLSLVVLGTAACASPTVETDTPPLSQEAAELASYVGSMYRIQADQLDALASLMLSAIDLDVSTEEDLIAQQEETIEETAAIYADFMASIEEVEPPARAASYTPS
jgi:hypothetical protein